MNDLPLAGRKTVVLGGSQGIGLAVAFGMARAGAHLILVARGRAALNEAHEQLSRSGFSASVFQASVLEKEALAGIVDRSSGAEVLVNCAGVQGDISPFHETGIEGWKTTFDINFFGTVNGMAAVLPGMIERRRGKIINFSGGGANYPRPNFSAYGAAKAAVVRLTETLAEELKDFHIQVNAVSPGMIKTRMIDQILTAGPEKAGKEHGQIQRMVERGFDSLDDVVDLCLFLASEESNWLTGKNISAVWDPWKEWRDKGRPSLDRDLYALRRIDGRTFVKAT